MRLGWRLFSGQRGCSVLVRLSIFHWKAYFIFLLPMTSLKVHGHQPWKCETKFDNSRKNLAALRVRDLLHTELLMAREQTPIPLFRDSLRRRR
jgi:hypothetical protein